MSSHSTSRHRYPQDRLPERATPADAAICASGHRTDPLLIACPNCDLLHRLAPQGDATLLCFRCGAVLYRDKPNSIERGLALTLTALILFVLSNSFPFLAMKSGGLVQETILLTGIRELWNEGMQGLAFLVLLTCVLVPLAQMLGLLYILAPLYGGRPPARHAGRVFRLVQEVAPWGMMEVFLIGVLVALVKLGHMATIVPGVSVFSFAVLIFIMAAAYSSLDPPLLWDRLDLRR
ncbi:MAG: paraquat-inducible protein A [Desulfobulbus sp.]|jgi:paraquat-inducible protein A|uniref:paraquat-inducible protein A n=1 Tax=Desulfobulbus sp. TaxID=895 RepID=UPI0028454FF4|nr:paraquat-inducible protein A [Desulfobulbus sp.]MDR2549938.1 paraquat-inducible protein A [Desulfobulbus sp.]